MLWSLAGQLALDLGGPTLTLLLAWMSIQHDSRGWFVGALMVALVTTLIQVGLRVGAAAAEQRIHEETSDVLDYLVGEIDQASQLEQQIRGDQNAYARFVLYRDAVEGWRTQTGNELERRLPRSGASQVFLAAVGKTGQGPLFWEYTQLCGCQEALVSILGSADAFVRRASARRG